jgi:hypothetical protein
MANRTCNPAASFAVAVASELAMAAAEGKGWARSAQRGFDARA